jgi:hypothetical protein
MRGKKKKGRKELREERECLSGPLISSATLLDTEMAATRRGCRQMMDKKRIQNITAYRIKIFPTPPSNRPIPTTFFSSTQHNTHISSIKPV